MGIFRRVAAASDTGLRPLWQSLLAAAVAGVMLASAFPSLGWWPMAPLGTAFMLWAFDKRRPGGAALVGLIGGFAFYGIHIFWLTTYLGLVPWLALAGLQTVFFALGGVLISLAWRYLPRALPGPWARLLLLPAVLAGLWLLRESVTSTWPYGGFSWGRLAFSQSESPLGDLAAWVGASGLSFIVALLGALLLQAARELRALGFSRAVLPRLIAVVAAMLVAFALPSWPTATSGQLRVAAVQGNSDASLHAQRERGDILDDHFQATMPVIDEEVDLVVWPENAADLNPLTHWQAEAALDYVSTQMDAPIVAGTITDGENDTTFNSLLLWKAGQGAVAQYDKMHPVPFAEYLPDRAFWYPFAPSLFDMIPRDYSIGTRDNVFDLDAPGTGGVRAGLAICFDIVDDALLRQMMANGAEIILAPTNNADFGRSDESVQQLAIARLRAIEYGRGLVNISTVGTSAIIAPDGSTISELEPFTAGAMVESVPLSKAVTPAAVIGLGIEWAAAALGLGGLLLALGIALARRVSARGITKEPRP